MLGTLIIEIGADYSMSKLKTGFIALLAIFSFTFSSVSEVMTPTQPEQTAQAAKLSTAQQIAKINSSLSKKGKKVPSTILPCVNLVVAILPRMVVVTVDTNC